MTVSATNASSGPYTGNGSTIAFPFTFRVETAAEAYLEVNGAQTPATLTLNVDANGKLTGGGTATAVTPPAVGTTVYVRSNPSFQQNISFANNGAFLPSVVEQGLDRAAERSVYLLGLYNTVSALASVASAAVAGAVTSAIAAAQAAINAAVFVVTSASGQTVSTRTLLAGISSPVNGQVATLTEAGRAGRFIFSTANLSAKVTADPYQGLYVAPTAASTGASGAWVRDVVGTLYLASWWGVGAAFGVNTDLPWQSALNLIPAGSTLILPNEVFTISGPVKMLQNGLKVFGGGPLTEVVNNSAFINMLQVARDDCEVAGFTMTGFPSNLGNGNIWCLGVTHANTGFVGTGPISRIRVHDMRLRNTSLGFTIFGNPNGTNLAPVVGCQAWNLDIETNVMGMELFGADQSEVRDFRITYFESVNTHNSTNALTPGIRLLSNHNLRVHDGYVDGFDAARPDHAGFRMSPGNSDNTNFGRRSNQDVIIENVTFKNFYGAGRVDECRGDCIVRNCEFYADTSSTAGSLPAFYVAPSGTTSYGTLEKAGHVQIINNKIEGWSYMVWYLGPIGQLTVENNRWLGNSATPSGTNYAVGFSDFGGCRIVEFVSNRCVVPAGVGWNIATSNANEWVGVFKNRFSEGNTNIQTQVTAGFANVGSSSGAGTFSAADNYTYPTGTWAARIAYGDRT